jgi:hypothetical protein
MLRSDCSGSDQCSEEHAIAPIKGYLSWPSAAVLGRLHCVVTCCALSVEVTPHIQMQNDATAGILHARGGVAHVWFAEQISSRSKFHLERDAHLSSDANWAEFCRVSSRDFGQFSERRFRSAMSHAKTEKAVVADSAGQIPRSMVLPTMLLPSERKAATNE